MRSGRGLECILYLEPEIVSIDSIERDNALFLLVFGL